MPCWQNARKAVSKQPNCPPQLDKPSAPPSPPLPTYPQLRRMIDELTGRCNSAERWCYAWEKLAKMLQKRCEMLHDRVTVLEARLRAIGRDDLVDDTHDGRRPRRTADGIVGQGGEK